MSRIRNISRSSNAKASQKTQAIRQAQSPGSTKGSVATKNTAPKAAASPTTSGSGKNVVITTRPSSSSVSSKTNTLPRTSPASTSAAAVVGAAKSAVPTQKASLKPANTDRYVSSATITSSAQRLTTITKSIDGAMKESSSSTASKTPLTVSSADTAVLKTKPTSEKINSDSYVPNVDRFVRSTPEPMPTISSYSLPYAALQQGTPNEISGVSTVTIQELQYRVTLPKAQSAPTINLTKSPKMQEKIDQKQNSVDSAAGKFHGKLPATPINGKKTQSDSKRTMSVANGKKKVVIESLQLAEIQKQGFVMTLDKLGVTKEQREYAAKSFDQVLKGNYSEHTTLLGSGIQIAGGFTGLDAPADLRDLVHDIQHWKWTKGHIAQTGLDAVSLLPVVGAIGKTDEAVAIGKAIRPAIDSIPLLKNGLLMAGTLPQNGIQKIGKNLAQKGLTLLREAPIVIKVSAKSKDIAGASLKTINNIVRNGNEVTQSVSKNNLSKLNRARTDTSETISRGKNILHKRIDAFFKAGKNILNGTDEANAMSKSAKAARVTEGAKEIYEDGGHITRSNRLKILRPNIFYKTRNGYLYETDFKSRIVSVKANLRLDDAARNLYAQSNAGRSSRVRGIDPDHGAHLIAKIFGGSGDIDNLVPMNGKLNLNEWRKLEREWADALKEGKEVLVDIKLSYLDDSLRPDNFDISYCIDGNWNTKKFQNIAGGGK